MLQFVIYEKSQGKIVSSHSSLLFRHAYINVTNESLYLNKLAIVIDLSSARLTALYTKTSSPEPHTPQSIHYPT
jgi:hypothetical protein